MPFITKARKKNEPSLRQPKAGLNKQEKEIFDIYYRALSRMTNDLDNSNVLRAVQEAIDAGNPATASIAFQWSDFVAGLDKTVPNLANQLAASANISAASLPKRVRIESNFTNKDPRAIAWAQQRAGARISGITKESQKAVAEVIADGLKSDLTRTEVITRLRKIVGLDARQAKALGNMFEKNLEQLLEEGYTYEEAEAEVLKMANEYRNRLLTQRATRIARTETLAAANAGRMLSWSEADARGLLPPDSLKRWKTATDERTCPTCAPLHNTTVGWQDSFLTGDVMPPVHPNCRCTAVIVPGVPVFEKSVEKRYYRFADGEETWRNYDYRWRKIANELKEKVGKCQKCGSKSDLTVDHIKRLKDGGAKYDRKNLRVLCRSCNGKMARLGTKLRKDAEPWWLAKHAPGKHDQQNHAGGRGSGGGSYSASADAIKTFESGSWGKDDVSPEDEKQLKATYREEYFESLDGERDVSRELQVENYATAGYQGINATARGSQKSDAYLENKISVIDRTIQESPDEFGDKTLYRVSSDRLIKDLTPGDTFIDKGFLSTTRKNVTTNASARKQLGNLSPTEDTVMVILPSPSRTGKGLAVDAFLKSRGYDGQNEFWNKEKEVLLPRDTPLLFLGISATTDTEGKSVAVFQRMDK